MPSLPLAVRVGTISAGRGGFPVLGAKRTQQLWRRTVMIAGVCPVGGTVPTLLLY
jgi:hypothetical protein